MLALGVFGILINPFLLGLAILIAVKCRTHKAKIFSTLLVAVVHWTILLPAVEVTKDGRIERLLSIVDIRTYLHPGYWFLIAISFLSGITVVYLIWFIVVYKRVQRSDVDSHYQSLSEAVEAEIQRDKHLPS